MRNFLSKEWTRCLRKIQHYGYNQWYRRKDSWRSKLSTMSNTWRKYYHQKEGSRETKNIKGKKYANMDERLRACFKCWNDNRRRDPWAITLENIRSNWRDRRKRINGKRKKG
jgi:hypothetical protein